MASTITTSIITGGTNNHATSSAEANALASDFVAQGVVGSFSNTAGVAPNTGAFAVNAQATPAMFVDVTAGVAYITATPTGQTSQSLRAYMAANYTSYAISANSSGATKYDWIYLQVSPTNANNPSAAADNVTALYTSRSSSNTSDNGSPPAYGILLAVVTVANGASTISNSQIQDRRSAATLNAPTAAGWTVGLATPNTVTYNGNRSYSLVTNGTDLTGTVSPGMRIRTTRTAAAPTQCTSLNGTTQYYSKTSPAGMTFTDDFTCSAWVKLTAYGNTTIVSRYNGTSGWQFAINTVGQVLLVGFNGGSSNFSQVLSYQSIALNKWVHVQANLDMSAFTTNTDGGASGSTVAIDGVNVPSAVSRGGTNPTALVQAGNLEVGSLNGGANLWSGKLAQVAVYNSKITIANVLTTISQGLAGTETSLISAYSFNNSISDLNTTNANNLTANGSAVATNADSPFGGQAGGSISSTLDCGIITSVSFSTNTTMVVQVPEGCTIPTSGGVSAIAYSTQKAPYGFPAQRGKWTIETIYRSLGLNTASNTLNSGATNGATALAIPIGDFTASYSYDYYSDRSATVQIYHLLTISTTNNTETDVTWTTNTAGGSGNGSTYLRSMHSKIKNISNSSATTLYIVCNTQNSDAGAAGGPAIYGQFNLELAHL